jgi:hypothetical protein
VTDLDSLNEFRTRIERLEARNRYLMKTMIGLVGVACGLCLLSGWLLYSVSSKETFHARKFSLEDEHGKQYAVLQIHAWESFEPGKERVPHRGPELSLFGEDGIPRVRLSATEQGSQLWLANPNPASLVMLGVAADGAGLVATNPTGTKQRFEMGNNEEACWLRMFDAKDKLRAEFGFDKDRSMMNVFDQAGKALAPKP